MISVQFHNRTESHPVEFTQLISDQTLRLYDPNYYYAYSIVEIIDDAPLPNICETALYAFEPDAVTSDLLITLGSLSREETPEQANVGRLFSDEVTLSCD